MMPSDGEPSRLLMIGEPGAIIELAMGLAHVPHATVSVGWTDPGVFDGYPQERCDLLTIDATLDLRDLLARLHGEPPHDGSASIAMRVPANDLVGHTIAVVERAMILRTLEHCHGNRTSAAAMLGISVRTMRNKLRSFLEDGEPAQLGADAA